MKNQRGSAMSFLILFIAVFIILSGICIELYHTITLRNYVEDELSRALRLSVEVSMIDQYRQDHISRIDKNIAKNEFENYLHDNMHLDENNQMIIDGELAYKIHMENIDIIEEPPSIIIKGFVEKSPLLFNLSQKIIIPYTVKASNTRLEESA